MTAWGDILLLSLCLDNWDQYKKPSTPMDYEKLRRNSMISTVADYSYDKAGSDILTNTEAKL